jgi:hypothetical protein
VLIKALAERILEGLGYEFFVNPLEKTFNRLTKLLIVPYHIHAILTDNGIQFTNRAKDK